MTPRALAAMPLCLALTACASWDRSMYEGMRQGANNAARQPEGRAVPQTTPLPDHDAYQRERARLRGDAGEAPIASGAAASAATR
jgi:hypothetical protein